MKLKPRSVSLITCFLLSSHSYADGFSIQHGSPTIAYSLPLQKFVKTITTYQPENPALNQRLQKTIDYYQRIHILKTAYKKNYTIDCIPFAEQPALIDNPALAQSLLPAMMNTTKNNLDTLKKMGSHFDFNPATECPLGSVALLRPSKAMLTSEAANTKIAPNRSSTHYNLLAAGYSWEQGVTPQGDLIYIPTQANQAYFKGPQNQYVSPANLADHSLDQFWYTTNIFHPREVLTYSVEFGIIASSYFTTTPATSIFVFASIDNYGSNSCYNLLCPNFIQAPGTTPIGVPITNTNADYIFQVKHVENPGFQPGYYLTLVTRGASANANASTLLGYYPDSLYAPANRPQQFSAGAEVYANAPGDGTIMYGNYANPCAGYAGPKQIGLTTRNGNNFTYSMSTGPAPYGLIWNFGQ